MRSIHDIEVVRILEEYLYYMNSNLSAKTFKISYQERYQKICLDLLWRHHSSLSGILSLVKSNTSIDEIRFPIGLLMRSLAADCFNICLLIQAINVKDTELKEFDALIYIFELEYTRNLKKILETENNLPSIRIDNSDFIRTLKQPFSKEEKEKRNKAYLKLKAGFDTFLKDEIVISEENKYEKLINSSVASFDYLVPLFISYKYFSNYYHFSSKFNDRIRIESEELNYFHFCVVYCSMYSISQLFEVSGTLDKTFTNNIYYYSKRFAQIFNR
jgi:hypothetical protein